MEFKSILDSVSKFRQDLQEKRRIRNSSRSSSPKVNLISSSFENTDYNDITIPIGLKENILIPTNRGELIEKYSAFKCPLPRPKPKPKSYKLDAAELLAVCIQKVIKKCFNFIKNPWLNKKQTLDQACIDQYAHQNSYNVIGKLQKNYLFDESIKINNAQCASIELTNKSINKASCEFLVAALCSILAHRKKVFLLALKSLHLKQQTAKLTSVTLMLHKHLKKVLNTIKLSSLMKLDLSKINLNQNSNSLRYSTPKYKVAQTTNNFIDHSKCNTTYTAQVAPYGLTPGKIIRIQNRNLEPDKKPPENNPTFGNEENPYSIHKLKSENEDRQKIIKKSIQDLEKSNVIHKKIVNKSRHDSLSSLNSSYRKSFIDNSKNFNQDVSTVFPQTENNSILPCSFIQGKMFKSDISPIKSEDKSEAFNNPDETWSHFNIDPSGVYEESSLKSFNHHTRHSSFDRDANGLSLKQETESLDLKFARIAKRDVEKSNRYCLVDVISPTFKTQELLDGSPNTFNTKFSQSAAKKRKEFIKRLEALSKLEETFCATLQILFKYFFMVLRVVRFECTLQKSQKVFLSGMRSGFLCIKDYIKLKNQHKILEFLICNYKVYWKRLTKIVLKKWKTDINLKTAHSLKIALGSKCIQKIIYKKHSYFNHWKNQAKNFQNPFNTCVSYKNLRFFINIYQKKISYALKHSWKCLKNNKNPIKIRRRLLLRKYIEVWEKETLFKQDHYIELFYHWRGLSKLEKMSKLKTFKKLFS